MTIRNRVAIVLLSLTILVGLTTQLVVAASVEMVGQTTSITAGETMGHGDGAHNPCKGFKPRCVDHAGCVLISGVSMIPVSAPAPVTWDEIEYGELAMSLAGLSIEPELSPPILAV
jgi:hypothetical protein